MKNSLFFKNVSVLVFLLLAMVAPAFAQKVVSTIKPVHSLVQGILGDTAKATLLVDERQSPHGFALKPSQMRAIANAEVVVYVDPTLEGFLPRALRNAKNATVVVLSQIKGVRVYDMREGGLWEGHDHSAHGHHDDHDEHGDHDDHNGHDDHGKHEKHDEHAKHDEHKKHDDHDDEHKHDDHKKHAKHEKHDDHDHDKHEEHADHDDHHEEGHTDHEGHDHAGSDPHIWLDPQNALVISDALEKIFSKKYPAHAKTFAANAAKQRAALKQLDAHLAKELKHARTPYIVFHDAYQYLEKRYKLNAQGSITLEPHDSPSIKRLQAIRKRLDLAKIPVIFREPQFSDKLIKTVIADRKITIGTLDPLGADVPAGADHYVTMMTQIGESLHGALASKKGDHDHHDHHDH